VIKAGWGYPAISLAGAGVAALGLAMVLVFAWHGKTRSQPAPDVQPGITPG